MFWSWSWSWSDCKAEEKHLFPGETVLLELVRVLKTKMACLLAELLSCCSCHGGDKQPVTMSFSIHGRVVVSGCR